MLLLILLFLFNALPSTFPQVNDNDTDEDKDEEDNELWKDKVRMLQVWILKTQAVIEEVNDRDLEKLVEENDFVAVAWFEIWSKD